MSYQEKNVWAKEQAESRGQSVHEVVATLREGTITCTITARQFNGAPRYSYSVSKEYEKDGEQRRSHWFDKRHTQDLLSIIDKADAWIKAAEAKKRK